MSQNVVLIKLKQAVAVAVDRTAIRMQDQGIVRPSGVEKHWVRVDVATSRNHNHLGEVLAEGEEGAPMGQKRTRLEWQQASNDWRLHQSVCHKGQHAMRCECNKCPGIELIMRKGTSDARMMCEECSEIDGRPVFLCNEWKRGRACRCHLDYHAQRFGMRKVELDEHQKKSGKKLLATMNGNEVLVKVARVNRTP